MPTKRAFILAAGLGTRMGEIGKLLPKVLWPVFDTTLIGLSVDFLKYHGVTDISINAHHLSEQVAKHCAALDIKINVLIEEKLLDAGGGVQNYLEEYGREDEVFILNSDQYISLSRDALVQMKVALNGSRAVLACMKNPFGFSGVKIKNGKMVDIVKDSEGPMFIGLTLLNPKGLAREVGKSKFFKSVANYKSEQVKAIEFDGTFIDFGSRQNYVSGCFKILQRLIGNPDDLEYWHTNGLIDKNKINHDYMSYDCEQKRVLNFTGAKLSHDWPKGSIVILEGPVKALSEKAVIVFGETLVELES